MTDWSGNELPGLLRTSARCPVCLGKLNDIHEGFRCSSCGHEFQAPGGIPLLLRLYDPTKVQEAEFFSQEAEQPGLASLARNFYKPLAYDRRLELVPLRFLKPDSLILSLGGGDGRHGWDLMQLGHRVLESDLSLGMVRSAARKFSQDPALRWAVAVIDAESIPFDQGIFDAVYMCACFHHIADRPALIRGIRRCLKPGGLVVFAAEPNAWFYNIIRPIARALRIRSIQMTTEGQAPGDETNEGVSYRDIHLFAKAAGLRILKIQPKYYLTGLIYQATEAAYRLLPPRFRHLLTIRQWEVQTASYFDAVIEQLPVINRYPLLWSIVFRKGD
jgi:SAM-dependent methyltransferase